MHFPVDSASGIPPCVGNGAVVRDDRQFILSFADPAGCIRRKTGIAIGMLRNFFSVEKYAGFLIDAFEFEKKGFPAELFRNLPFFTIGIFAAVKKSSPAAGFGFRGTIFTKHGIVRQVSDPDPV